LAERFRKPRLGLVSNSAELGSLALELGFSFVLTCPETDGEALRAREDDIVATVRERVAPGTPLMLDVMFCYLVRGKDDMSSRPYIELLGSVADSVKARKTLLRVAVAGYGDCLGQAQQELVEESLYPLRPLEVMGFRLPRQSCEIYEREEINVKRFAASPLSLFQKISDQARITIVCRIPLYVAYHCDGVTRRDGAQAFTERECHLGGNGKILAYHLLSEIGFLLGRRPKYGA